jgi:hypothetical protein
MEDPTVQVLAESENFNVWRTQEPDGETTYHLELGLVTVHFFVEEWQEFLKLIGEAREHAAAG